ncbi:hypothetical protein F4778DRAFT_132846 [Xylariomycetidae sp. FL2044]|nr:hypothetical protein F4778DRAFT_132846 [Xylariomycetidae sp. FL2044]
MTTHHHHHIHAPHPRTATPTHARRPSATSTSSSQRTRRHSSVGKHSTHSSSSSHSAHQPHGGGGGGVLSRVLGSFRNRADAQEALAAAAAADGRENWITNFEIRHHPDRPRVDKRTKVPGDAECRADLDRMQAKNELRWYEHRQGVHHHLSNSSSVSAGGTHQTRASGGSSSSSSSSSNSRSSSHHWSANGVTTVMDHNSDDHNNKKTQRRRRTPPVALQTALSGVIPGGVPNFSLPNPSPKSNPAESGSNNSIQRRHSSPRTPSKAVVAAGKPWDISDVVMSNSNNNDNNNTPNIPMMTESAITTVPPSASTIHIFWSDSVEEVGIGIPTRHSVDVEKPLPSKAMRVEESGDDDDEEDDEYAGSQQQQKTLIPQRNMKKTPPRRRLRDSNRRPSSSSSGRELGPQAHYYHPGAVGSHRRSQGSSLTTKTTRRTSVVSVVINMPLVTNNLHPPIIAPMTAEILKSASVTTTTIAASLPHSSSSSSSDLLQHRSDSSPPSTVTSPVPATPLSSLSTATATAAVWTAFLEKHTSTSASFIASPTSAYSMTIMNNGGAPAGNVFARPESYLNIVPYDMLRSPTSGANSPNTDTAYLPATPEMPYHTNFRHSPHTNNKSSSPLASKFAASESVFRLEPAPPSRRPYLAHQRTTPASLASASASTSVLPRIPPRLSERAIAPNRRQPQILRSPVPPPRGKSTPPSSRYGRPSSRRGYDQRYHRTPSSALSPRLEGGGHVGLLLSGSTSTPAVVASTQEVAPLLLQPTVYNSKAHPASSTSSSSAPPRAVSFLSSSSGSGSERFSSSTTVSEATQASTWSRGMRYPSSGTDPRISGSSASSAPDSSSLSQYAYLHPQPMPQEPQPPRLSNSPVPSYVSSSLVPAPLNPQHFSGNSEYAPSRSPSIYEANGEDEVVEVSIDSLLDMYLDGWADDEELPKGGIHDDHHHRDRGTSRPGDEMNCSDDRDENPDDEYYVSELEDDERDWVRKEAGRRKIGGLESWGSEDAIMSYYEDMNEEEMKANNFF